MGVRSIFSRGAIVDFSRGSQKDFPGGLKVAKFKVKISKSRDLRSPAPTPFDAHVSLTILRF